MTTTSSSRIQHLIILDASGSMQSIKEATISGFNELVEGIQNGQQMYPEVHNSVSLVIFNSGNIQRTLWMQPVSSARQLHERSYIPNGGTPLFDAMGVSITHLEECIGNDADTKVIVNIITDGEENASRHFNREDIKRLVDRLSEQGWTFTYIGANVDAMQEAQSMNIQNHLQYCSDRRSVRRMFQMEADAKYAFMDRVSKKEVIAKDDYYSNL